MERIDQIIAHNVYRQYLDKIAGWEEKRIFCHHDTNHFLNVARIGWIINLEENIGVEKVHIYAAALLHDIGRFRQYEDGSDHALVSAKLAVPILKDCGFCEKEQAEITDAISTHRNSLVSGERNLRGILYRADKLSRECYFCPAEKQCDWKKEKKNKILRY